MGITRTQLGGVISVVSGIFLFKSLTYAPFMDNLLSNYWWLVAALTLSGILFHDKIARTFIK